MFLSRKPQARKSEDYQAHVICFLLGLGFASHHYCCPESRELSVLFLISSSGRFCLGYFKLESKSNSPFSILANSASLKSNSILRSIYFCVCEHLACMNVSALLCMPIAQGGQMSTLDPLELELCCVWGPPCGSWDSNPRCPVRSSSALSH